MSLPIETGQVGQQLCQYAGREGLGLAKGQDPLFYLFGFALSAESPLLRGSKAARRPMKS